MANSRRAVTAFCLYDVGNSAFATTILAVLYNQYYANAVAGGPEGIALLGTRLPGATLYTWLVSVTMLFVAVAGPILGARADARGRRIAWLRGLTIAGGIATIALASVGSGDWVRGGLLFIVAYGTFAAASIFYNAVLPSLAPAERLGWVSGLAWGLGYLGGALALGASLLLLSDPGRFGLAGQEAALRASFAFAGVWWLAFAVPLMRLPEPAPPRVGPAGARAVFAEVGTTLRRLSRSRHFFRYLLAYFLYNDGVQTVVATASIFAASELGFEAPQLIQLFLVIQATGFVGALAAGRIADRVGHKPTILFHVGGWLGITLWARWVGLFGDPVTEFWILGILAGLLLGGIQTASRSLLARWVPVGRSAEIFGFFAVAGRFASVGGPLLFGALAWAFGGLRPAILSVSLFFLAGGFLMSRVRESEAAQELQDEAATETSSR
ncbi:MAG: MFS transporter [Candidatus Eisenbacteria bacterium]|nr:MFS transporter [Candidatus Latescibacterota bacterium]MBD3301920.1 MFS transporter [Candidatus Eisenbacteria bacterium]